MRERTYRTTVVAITAAIAALLLSACSTSSTETDSVESLQTDTVTSANEATPSTDFTATDLMFAEMMIPHHEQAIEMSQLALERSQDPEVLALAEQILAVQAPEIAEMKTWGALNLEAHAGHTMMGMLTPDQMSALAAATGSEFDRLFLAGMIVHHEGAIQMAQMVIQSPNPQAKQLGEEVVANQLTEIKLMQEMLAAR